jgi:hypothetical protein
MIATICQCELVVVANINQNKIPRHNTSSLGLKTGV